MNHTLHLLLSILTIVWFIGWIVMAMMRPYDPWHCVACGCPEGTPIPANDQT